ncbi:MAG: tetratricopeptide repeat protein [Candidatus Omnitrophota bacterium]
MHKFKSFLIISLLITSICLLSPSIDNYHYDFLSKKGVFQEDMLYRVLGDTGKIFSDYSYITADIYYHGGIYDIKNKECKHMEHAGETLSKKDDKKHLGDELLHEKGEHAKDVSKLNILVYIGERAHINEHAHLHGDEKRELVPWFYYAVRLNPNNIDAYVVGGYWIGQQLNKPNEAIKFLKKGLIDNPDSWKIYNQIGMVHFTENMDYNQALANFKNASTLLTNNNSDEFDQREVYSLMAACYEKLGKIDKAIECYRKILVLSPRDKSILKKIASLGD